MNKTIAQGKNMAHFQNKIRSTYAIVTMEINAVKNVATSVSRLHILFINRNKKELALRTKQVLPSKY